MPIRMGNAAMSRPEKADKLVPSLRLDLRGFRVLFWRGPGGGHDELAACAGGGCP